MKVGEDCALCLFQRGYLEILEATDDAAARLKAAQALLRMLAENFQPTSVPAILGTMKDKLIKKETKNPDPFAELKRTSNLEALKILPFVKKIIAAEPTTESKFRKACLAAIIGNIMDFNIPGYHFDFSEISSLILRAEKDLVIDDVSRAFTIAKRAGLTLYLTDNAGEIAFDTLLMKELKNMSKDGRVVVAVRDEPIYNDATIEDALYVGMDKVADSIVTTGTDAMGLIAFESDKKFLELYNSADFVIAKGMGYAETLTELDLKAPHLLLLRTKCTNVANYFQVPREKNIAMLI